MTLHTLQIGMEWYTERPGGLNSVYAHLLAELAAQDVESVGLVAGTPAVAAASGGLAHAFANVDAPLVTRLRGVRAAARPWLRSHGNDAVVVSHFALYALPVLDHLRHRPFVVHFQGPWGEESRLEGASRFSVAQKGMLERQVYRQADAAILKASAVVDRQLESLSSVRDSPLRSRGMPRRTSATVARRELGFNV